MIYRPAGIAIATKGILCPVQVGIGGGGGPGRPREDEFMRPRITVERMSISKEKVRATGENVQVTGVKIVLD